MRSAMRNTPMTTKVALPLWSVLLTTVVCTSPVAGQTCRPTDPTARAILAWAKDIATGSSDEAVATRAQLKIPSTTANKVTLVTDATTCLKAVQAYAADGNFPPTNIAVYLVKVNTSYILKDPILVSGSYWPSVVLDSKFKLLSRFTG
jgi:hypothetical protein